MNGIFLFMQYYLFVLIHLLIITFFAFFTHYSICTVAYVCVLTYMSFEQVKYTHKEHTVATPLHVAWTCIHVVQ